MDLFTAKKLTELRKHYALSQETLAEKVGVSRQAISKWERGEASPDTDNLLMLSKIYGVSLDDLLGDKSAEEIIEEKKNEEKAQSASKEIPPEKEASPKLYSDTKNDEPKKGKEPYIPGIGKSLLKFPFFLVIVILYLAIGFTAQIWHPTWIMFLTIPAYYLTAVAFLANTKKKFLLLLPVYMYAVILYIVMGFSAGLWHPSWIIFLCIPAYYWAIGMIKS